MFQQNVSTLSTVSLTRTVRLQKIFYHTYYEDHRQAFLVSCLTYLVQILYLGKKLLRPKYNKFSLKLRTFPMLQYYNINCKTVTILFYLLIIQLTVYNNNEIYCRWQGCLSASETGDAIDFRQQLLNTTSFELEITVNYPVHTWTENGSFTRKLTSWTMPFWLVLLTEHKVLHCYATNAVYRCLVAGPVLWILLSRLSMLPTFQPSLSVFCAPYRFNR